MDQRDSPSYQRMKKVTEADLAEVLLYIASYEDVIVVLSILSR
jgi:hypothetical protein